MTQASWPLRSLLFLPATRIDWVRKIARSSVDAIILDLEDSVIPERKHEARSLIGEAVEVLDSHGVAVVVRINALGHGGEEDLPAVVLPGVLGIMLPKADSATDVHRLDRLIAEAESKNGVPAGKVGIVALPETAAGLWAVREIAGASPRVTGLITAVSGPIAGDVSRAAGFSPTVEGSEQLFLQSRTILASRAAGANYPIGTIQGTRLDDLDTVELLARRAKQLGFSGVALIHPSHVPIANAIFRPTEAEVEHAKGLVEALMTAAKAGNGATRHEGVMVDIAMLAPARELLARAERFRLRDEERSVGR